VTPEQRAGLTKALLTGTIDATTEVPLGRFGNADTIEWWSLGAVGTGVAGWYYQFSNVLESKQHSLLLLNLAQDFTAQATNPCRLPKK